MLYRQKKAWASNFLVHAVDSVLWAFSATILRPLTFARNYANLRRTKKQIKEGMAQAVRRETAKPLRVQGKAEPPESGSAGRLRARTGVKGEAGCKVSLMARILRAVFT